MLEESLSCLSYSFPYPGILIYQAHVYELVDEDISPKTLRGDRITLDRQDVCLLYPVHPVHPVKKMPE